MGFGDRYLADQAIVFPVEQIPDADFVYMRAHRNLIPKGVIEPGVFRERDGSMSVDWDRYCSPQITRQRARKNPQANAVLKINVGGIRRLDSIRVEHAQFHKIRPIQMYFSLGLVRN